MDGFDKLIEFEQMNKWSDEARAASAEARRGGSGEKSTGAGGATDQVHQEHKAALEKIQGLKFGTPEYKAAQTELKSAERRRSVVENKAQRYAILAHGGKFTGTSKGGGYTHHEFEHPTIGKASVYGAGGHFHVYGGNNEHLGSGSNPQEAIGKAVNLHRGSSY